MEKYSRLLASRIGANVKFLRRWKYPARGGQKACASAFGVDASYFVKWEAGRVLPSDENQFNTTMLDF